MATLLMHRDGLAQQIDGVDNPLWDTIERWSLVIGRAVPINREVRLIVHKATGQSPDLTDVRYWQITDRDTGQMTTEQANGLIATGLSLGVYFDVVRWACMFQLSPGDNESAVPAVLPNAHFINEDGTQGDLKTWDQWAGPNHSFQPKADGKLYLSTAAWTSPEIVGAQLRV